MRIDRKNLPKKKGKKEEKFFYRLSFVLFMFPLRVSRFLRFSSEQIPTQNRPNMRKDIVKATSVNLSSVSVAAMTPIISYSFIYLFIHTANTLWLDVINVNERISTYNKNMTLTIRVAMKFR